MQRRMLWFRLLLLAAVPALVIGCGTGTAQNARTAEGESATAAAVPTTEATAPTAPTQDATTGRTAPAEPSEHAAPSTLTCPGEMQGLSLSLTSDVVGLPSPIEAAQWFVDQSWATGFDPPPGAVWVLGATDDLGVGVLTEGIAVHAIQLTDGTWTIDSGSFCR